MPKYSYVALDNRGQESKGVIEVASQNEAIGRVKEMGLFPTKIFEAEKVKEKGAKKSQGARQEGQKGLDGYRD
jgi:type IV pilus assembly protein PilC